MKHILHDNMCLDVHNIFYFSYPPFYYAINFLLTLCFAFPHMCVSLSNIHRVRERESERHKVVTYIEMATITITVTTTFTKGYKFTLYSDYLG